MTTNLSDLVVDKFSDEELLRYVESILFDACYSMSEVYGQHLPAEACVGGMSITLAMADAALKKYIAKKYGDEPVTTL